MRGFTAVFRRELKAVFASPLIGTVGGIYLLLVGLMSWLNLRDYLRANAELAVRFRMMNRPPQWLDFNEALVGQDLSALAFLSLIFLPLLAMNLLAEERRSGTLDLVLTSPLGEGALVLGKWCAALLVFAGLAALSLPGLLLLSLFAPLSWPALAAAFAGVLLAAGAFLALCLLAGSLTRSPVIAAAFGFALLLLLWIAASFARPGAAGFPGGLLAAASTLGHLDPWLRGLVSTADLVYFLAVSALGLEMTRRSLQLQREGGSRLLAWRARGLQGLIRGLATLIVACLAIFLAGRYPARWDLSPGASRSVDAQTREILDNLDAPLSITLFFPDREPERSEAAALLGAFKAGRPDLAWELVDPGQQPRRAVAAGVTQPGTVLLRYGDRSASFVAAREGQGGGFQLEEHALAMAILDLSRDRRAILRVAQGPGLPSLGDPDGLLSLRLLLEMERYRVEPWMVLSAPGAQVPDSTDLLLVAGPRRALPPAVVAGIRRYLEAGGALLVLLDPDAEMADGSAAAGLDSLLGARGIRPLGGYVVDLGDANRNLGKGLDIPVAAAYGEHPVTLPFLQNPLPCSFPLARAFELADAQALPLVLSGKESYLETSPPGAHAHFDAATEKGGPLVMAAASDRGPRGGDLVVIGDSDFAFAANLDWQGNADLLLQAAAHLSRPARGLAPAGRPPAELLYLDRGARRLYLALTVIALPGALMALWPLRRLLARRRSPAGGAS